jgi:hypothetical protein
MSAYSVPATEKRKDEHNKKLKGTLDETIDRRL